MRVIVFFVAAAVFAQLDSPRIGVLCDRAGVLRPILGVAGSFVAGEALAEGAVSAAFFEDRGFVKFERTVKTFDRRGREIAEFDAPKGPAIFSRTMAYFPGDRSLWRMEDDGLKPMPLDEDVVALGDDFLIARRGATLWRMRTTGELLESFADRSGSVIVLEDGGLLWAADLPLEDVRELALLGNGWVHVRTANASYALRLSTGKLYLLPEPAP